MSERDWLGRIGEKLKRVYANFEESRLLKEQEQAYDYLSKVALVVMSKEKLELPKNEGLDLVVNEGHHVRLYRQVRRIDGGPIARQRIQYPKQEENSVGEEDTVKVKLLPRDIKPGKLQVFLMREDPDSEVTEERINKRYAEMEKEVFEITSLHYPQWYVPETKNRMRERLDNADKKAVYHVAVSASNGQRFYSVTRHLLRLYRKGEIDREYVIDADKFSQEVDKGSDGKVVMTEFELRDSAEDIESHKKWVEENATIRIINPEGGNNTGRKVLLFKPRFGI